MSYTKPSINTQKVIIGIIVRLVSRIGTLESQEIDVLDRFAYIEGKYDMNHHNDTRFIIFLSK